MEEIKERKEKSIKEYKSLENFIAFLKTKLTTIEDLQKKEESEFLKLIESEGNKPQLKKALANIQEEFTSYEKIITTYLYEEIKEPTQEELNFYFESLKRNKLFTIMGEEQVLIYLKNFFLETQFANKVQSFYKHLKEIELKNQELKKINNELLNFFLLKKDPVITTLKESYLKKTNNPTFFLLTNNPIMHNFFIKNLDTEEECLDKKYKYNYILKTDESLYKLTKGDLTRSDKLLLDCINTLLKDCKEDRGENIKGGFYLTDLYNLMNGGERRLRDLNTGELKKLRKQIDKLANIRIVYSITYRNGSNLKGKNKEEQDLIKIIKPRQLIDSYEIIQAVKSNQKTKEEKILKEYYLFNKKPLLLKISEIENKITKIDKRLLFIKQPNDKTRELNSYLIDTIELLKVSNNNKIFLENLIGSLKLWISDREDKRQLKNQIKKRLDYFIELKYIKSYQAKKDCFIIKNYDCLE